jgi:hypothetical protein
LKRPSTLALAKQHGGTPRKIGIDNDPAKKHEIRSENQVFLQINVTDKNFDQESKSYVYLSGFQESIQREEISDKNIQGI